ncbi:MAG: hypothetical protein U1D30_00005, partial [Planctomycetota bacterium]
MDSTITRINLDFADVPKELKDLKKWITWFRDIRHGKPTKIPGDPGQIIDVTEKHHWGPFERLHKCLTGAVERAIQSDKEPEIAGIGFVFSADDPYVGIDLDKCREPATGVIEDWAQDILDRLHSYAEVSPSGTGVKIIGRGKLPGKRCRTGNIEMYDQGRFFTITGCKVDCMPSTVEDVQIELDKLYEELFPKEPSKPRNGVHVPTTLADGEIIKRATAVAKYAALWAGEINGYGSQSEADQALANRLAFFCGHDPSRVDRLFRQSGLMREKWDREDYRSATIDKAITGCK